jgi:hypothetical protein
MKNIESMPVRHLQGENEFPKKGDSIFEKISHGARAFHTPWMAVDMHTVYLLVCLAISLPFRTNDRNGVTSLVQRCDLRPDPAIGRHRRVFDDDKDRAGRITYRMLADRTIAPTSVSGNLATFRIELPKEEHNLEVADDPQGCPVDLQPKDDTTTQEERRRHGHRLFDRAPAPEQHSIARR